MNRENGDIWLTVFTGNSGLTHYSFCLARALHEAGVDVTLVTNANYELDSFGGRFPVRKLFHRSRRYPLDIIRFWRAWRRERPAVVHYQAFLKVPAIELILLKLQKRKGTRLVYTAHDWLPHRRRRYHPLLFRLYYRQFDRIIVHSKRGADFLAGELGVSPEKLNVIPHGEYGFFVTDAGLSPAAARKRLGLDADRTWYLFFGHIDEYKGLDTALEALGRIDRGDAPGLIVAGNPGGGDFSRYADIIERDGLHDRVSLNLGHVPVADIQLYFQAADVLLLPYRESSTSGLAHVAMGFGLPVIASNVGALPVLVQEAGAGVIVPPGDVDALAAAMRRLADHEDERRRLGAAWDGIAAEHTWDDIAGKTIAVYRSAMKVKEAI